MDPLRQFRLLLWLRLKLTLHQYTASKGRLFGLVAALLTLGPMSIAAAWLLHLWLQGQSPPVREEALHFLYFGVFVLWVTAPILGFRANEFLDTTKLFVYPVAHRTVFLATLTGSLTSGMLLFFLPVLVAATLALEGGRGVALTRLAVLLPALVLLAQVAIQCLTLSLLNLLRSRRFRDLAAILAAVFGMMVYLGFRLFAERLGVTRAPQLLGHGFSRYLALFPPYWISKAAVSLPEAGILALLSGLVPVAALGAGLAGVGVWLQRRAFFGEIPFARPPRREAARARRGPAPVASWILPDDVGAIVAKELAVLRREPAVKTQLISQATYLVIPIAISLFSRRGDAPDASIAPLVFPGLLAALSLAESFLFLNLLGLEGSGIHTLLSTPMPRRRILLGKDVAYVALFGVVNTLFVAALSLILKFALDRPWSAVAGEFLLYTFLGLCLLVVLVSLGNLISILLPMRLLARGRRALSQQSVEREGCGKALLRVVSFGGVLVYLAPVAFVLLLPRLPGSPVGPWFFAVSIPFVLAYAGATWLVSLRIAESWLLKKEVDILAFFTASPQ